LLGKDIEMPSELEFSKNLQLKPDITTLRQSILSPSGAFVLADPIEVPFAPRSLLQ
jgi:hypothetical protein